jgi:hypothetical protein
MGDSQEVESEEEPGSGRELGASTQLEISTDLRPGKQAETGQKVEGPTGEQEAKEEQESTEEKGGREKPAPGKENASSGRPGGRGQSRAELYAAGESRRSSSKDSLSKERYSQRKAFAGRGAENWANEGWESERAIEEWEGEVLPYQEGGRRMRPSATRTDPDSLCYRSRQGKTGRGFKSIYDPIGEASTGPSDVGYYHSGVNRKVFVKWIAEERKRTGKDLRAMVNANSASEPSLLDAYAEYPEVPIALDSGAFQGEMDHPAEYLEVVEKIDQGLKDRGGAGIATRFDWIANLDVGIQTGRNFHWLRERGIEPMWVAHILGPNGKINATVRPPAESTYELRKGMTIGIGKLVPVIRKDSSLARDVIGRIGEKLGRLGVKGHFFGLGAPGLLKQFASKSWMESADSSKWLAGQKWRKMYRQDGSSVKVGDQGLSLTREECARQNLRQIGGWVEGSSKGEQKSLFAGE